MDSKYEFIDKKILGHNIRLIRKSCNITMKALGSLVGVSEQAISQYERGLREPGIEILNKISHALDFPYNIFTSKKIKKVVRFETFSQLTDYEHNNKDSTSYTDDYSQPVNLIKYKKELNNTLLTTIDNINIEIDESAKDRLITSTINNFFTELFKLQKKSSDNKNISTRDIHYIFEDKLLYIIAEI